MPEPAEIEREIESVEVELRRLETAYTLFFSGRLPRPPSEVRAQVEARLKRLDRTYIDKVALRFRFQGLQTRFVKLAELWDRGLRSREEGRPGPFAERPLARPRSREERPREESDTGAGPARVVSVVAIGEPSKERDKVGTLYQSLVEARRQSGEPAVPYERFEALVEERVQRLRKSGAREVAFRITLKDGKPHLAARALRGAPDDSDT